MFSDAIVGIEPRLCPPTDMEARKDMAFRPVEDALEFLPVGDVFEVKVLYWGAGHN